MRRCNSDTSMTSASSLSPREKYLGKCNQVFTLISRWQNRFSFQKPVVFEFESARTGTGAKTLICSRLNGDDNSWFRSTTEPANRFNFHNETTVQIYSAMPIIIYKSFICKYVNQQQHQTIRTFFTSSPSPSQTKNCNCVIVLLGIL